MVVYSLRLGKHCGVFLRVVEDAASQINMSFNIKKTQRIVFNPYNRGKIICGDKM